MGAWPRAFGLRNPPRLSLCLVLLAAAGHYLGGCGSGAQLSNAWRDSGYTGPPPRSALILAMKKDAVARRVWEDAFAAELGTPLGMKGYLVQFHLRLLEAILGRRLFSNKDAP